MVTSPNKIGDREGRGGEQQKKKGWNFVKMPKKKRNILVFFLKKNSQNLKFKKNSHNFLLILVGSTFLN
jgi:hypothetical protein